MWQKSPSRKSENLSAQGQIAHVDLCGPETHPCAFLPLTTSSSCASKGLWGSHARHSCRVLTWPLCCISIACSPFDPPVQGLLQNVAFVRASTWETSPEILPWHHVSLCFWSLCFSFLSWIKFYLVRKPFSSFFFSITEPLSTHACCLDIC